MPPPYQQDLRPTPPTIPPSHQVLLTHPPPQALPLIVCVKSGGLMEDEEFHPLTSESEEEWTGAIHSYCPDLFQPGEFFLLIHIILLD